MYVDARLAVLGLRGDRAEDRARAPPRPRVEPPGIIDGPAQRALLAARHAHADEVEAARRERRRAAIGVGEERVAAVDQDVARLEVRAAGAR